MSGSQVGQENCVSVGRVGCRTFQKEFGVSGVYSKARGSNTNKSERCPG